MVNMGLFNTKRPNKRLAKIISIKSPAAFRRSISTLKKGRYTLHEQRALQLAKARAKASLQRRHLSRRERQQFRTITKIRIPKYKKKSHYSY